MPSAHLRNLKVQFGSMLDGVDEVVFRICHGPRGLAYEQAEVGMAGLDRAIVLAAEFISEQQCSDGSLRGFHLYPGTSTSWVTAHAAFVLEGIHEVERVCRNAANFLHRVGPQDGGWGFNRRVAIDCDCTAQALMVLHGFDLPIHPFLLNNLLSAQSPCGGFPTYKPEGPGSRPANGWQEAHPEVSALVLEMLRRVGGYDEEAERCERWLQSQFVDAVLPSYWWSGDFYGLWAQARTAMLTAEALPAVGSLLHQPSGILQLCCVLTAACQLSLPDEIIRTAASKLLLTQHADGSWDCAPCLRLTDPAWRQATAEAPGIIVSDKRRTFSTVHAIAALAQVRKRVCPAGTVAHARECAR